MSFLESGKTIRTTFNQMPPKRHDLDTSKSEVLAYICEQMGCDLGKAIRAFNSMRHPKCRVLVFDKMERQWKGCEFRPSDAETSELSIIREHRSFERQLSVLKSAIRRMQGDIEDLKRKASARPKWKKVKQDEAVDEPVEPDEETGIEDNGAFIPQINIEEANRIALVAQQKRQKELEAEQKENFRKAMMISH
jgi:hypothetical protein